MTPTILFVPGFWEGPAPFAPVTTILQSAGYPTQTATLPSTGTSSPGNPSMKDDIAAVRSRIIDLIDDDDGGGGKPVVLVLHSAGGFVGSNAAEGLDVKARRGKGLKGGVCRIVFLTGAVFPVGYRHAPLPFFTYDSGAMRCSDPQTTLFNDLPPAEASKWAQTLQIQPAAGWDDVITYGAWRDVPSVYLVCEGDRCIPAEVQLQMAALAGSRVERCAAGHMPMLSVPERVVEVVVEVVAEVVREAVEEEKEEEG